MTQTGVDHKKRGANIMKTGIVMLVLGVALSLALSIGQDEPSGAVGFLAFVAFAGFIVTLIGLGKWRERPAGN